MTEQERLQEMRKMDAQDFVLPDLFSDLEAWFGPKKKAKKGTAGGLPAQVGTACYG